MVVSRNTLIFLVSIFAFAFLPFFFLCYFNYPSSDDYLSFVYVRSNGIVESVKMYYTILTGRYFSIFIVCAFYSIAVKVGLYSWWYKIFIFLNLCFLSGSLTFLFSRLFKSTGILSSAILAFSMLLFFNSILLNISEFYFWLQGTVCYVLSISLMCIFFSLLYFEVHKIAIRIVLFLLAIMISGSVETSIILFNIIYFTVLIIRWINGTKPNKFLIYLSIWILIFTFIELQAPGNRKRGEEYLIFHAQEPVFALKSSIAYFLKMIGGLAIHPATWLFSIFYIYFNRNQPSFISVFLIKRNRPFLIALLLYVPFILVSFLVFYSFGGVKLETRIMSALTILLGLIWVGQLEILRSYVNLFLYRFNYPNFILISLSILMFLSAFIKPSAISVAFKDLISGDAASYRLTQLKRFELMKQPRDLIVLTDFDVKPTSIYVQDINIRENYFINPAYARTFGKKSVKLLKLKEYPKWLSYPFHSDSTSIQLLISLNPDKNSLN
jgi:hypothetical protein